MKQFCLFCGQVIFICVLCSMDVFGNFILYFKKNFQFNNCGNVYSIFKLIYGFFNIKCIVGGGKNGWGNELILVED